MKKLQQQLPQHSQYGVQWVMGLSPSLTVEQQLQDALANYSINKAFLIVPVQTQGFRIPVAAVAHPR
jgi:hypothetical protein